MKRTGWLAWIACAALAAVFMLAMYARAADTGTVATATERFAGMTTYTLTWTTGTNDFGVLCNMTNHVRGELLRAMLKSSTASGNYTVTVKDELGMDTLAKRGSSVVSNATVNVVPGIPYTTSTGTGGATNAVPFALNDILSIAVTNAGNGTSGTITYYVR